LLDDLCSGSYTLARPGKKSASGRIILRFTATMGASGKLVRRCNRASFFLPLVKSRAASHIEPPKFAFRPPILAELHGAAPGIEPGACRARSENHDTRPSSQVLVDTHKLTLRLAGPNFRHRCFGCCFYADIQL